MGSPCVVICIVLVIFCRSADTCGPERFEPVHILETELSGYVVVNITAEPDTTWKLDFKESKLFTKNSVAFPWLASALTIQSKLEKTGAGLHQVLLAVQMDLELTYTRWQMKISDLLYTLTCNKDGFIKDHNLMISVEAVNEYPPEFVGGPYEVSVRENYFKGVPIIKLRENTTDKDVFPHADTDIKDFKMKLLLQDGQTKQMKNYFIMDKMKGDITVGSSLDFEGFPDPDNASMVYELTVYDHGGLSATTNITIHVEDVDDEPPHFFFPGCLPNPCDVVYVSKVDYRFTGPITEISPASIQAKDWDSFGYEVKYRLKSGPQRPKFRTFLTMDENTGEVTVTEPLEAFYKTEIVLIIQATEVSKVKQTKDTTLVIHIQYPEGYVFPNEVNTVAPTQAPGLNKDNSQIIILGGVGGAIFLLIAFISLGVLITYMKKRAEKPIYPSSEEGDVDDDENNVTPITTTNNNNNRKQAGQGRAGTTDTAQASGSSNIPQGRARPGTAKTAGEGPGGVKKAMKKKAPGTAKGARRINSARSDMSKTSKVSASDIYPDAEDMDPDQAAMMFQEMAAMHGYADGEMFMPDENGMFPDGSYMDENMAAAFSQMQYDGQDMVEDEDETGNGGHLAAAQMMQMQQQRRPRPPKSAPAGKRGRGVKTPNRPQSGVGQRQEPSGSAEEDEF